MTDDLDQLSDAALSERFAVEVADEKPERLAFASNDGGKSGCLFEASRFGCDRYGVSRHAIEEHCRKYPEYKLIERDVYHGRYATSADAVLPFLERAGTESINGDKSRASFDGETWCVFIEPRSWDDSPHLGQAPTFPRAACIALLRAKRAEKGGAS